MTAFRRTSLARSASLAVIGVGVILSAVGCGQDVAAPPLQNLDRPTEMTFTCYGDLRVDDTVITSAQPNASCADHLDGDETPPPGQEELIAPGLFGFVLQPSQGTVAVVNVKAQSVIDTDNLTPGLNDLPVGALPVGLVTDESGCHVMTANSGSCDLATIDVNTALTPQTPAKVSRVPLTSPAGTPILSRPRAVAMSPESLEVGNVCPSQPAGTLYVSFPACKIVAAVDPAEGRVVSGMLFQDDGVIRPALEADYQACPVQCGEGIAHGTEPELFDERPSEITVSPAGDRLYVTSDTSPFFSVIDLDPATGRPTGTVRRTRVSGDVGLRAFAVTDPIAMGGYEAEDSTQLPGSEFQFAYAIATDATIRVIDLDAQVECDTQVDPRYLRDVTDVDFLACMPVDDPRTPPRRFGAIGPGIQLSQATQNRAVPLDLQFVTLPSLASPASQRDPNLLVGTFAFVSMSIGGVVIVNVDDDNYADYEDPDDPVEVEIPLALPHQLRDNVVNRAALGDRCSTPDQIPAFLGAREHERSDPIFNSQELSPLKGYLLPTFQGIACEAVDDLGNPLSAILSEFSFAAEPDVRESTFRDIASTPNQQGWLFDWEGPLSIDGFFDDVDGPATKPYIGVRAGDVLHLESEHGAICATGVRPYDIASLAGCDPLNARCGVGEECYLHPDTPASVGRGVCVPTEYRDQLINTCRDFFISNRRYSVTKAETNKLRVIERNRVLSTSPVDGCLSDTECVDLARQAEALERDGHPVDIDVGEIEDNWVCRADPSRAPGIDRCLLACETSEDCGDGLHCNGTTGLCVEGPLPPSECLLSLQEVQLLVGEAFTVVGGLDGFIHDTVVEPTTGECISPPGANLLATSRLPLQAEPCDDDDDPRTGPNPCSTTVSHTERFIPYEFDGTRCVAGEATTETTEVPAIRFENTSMRFHLVKPTTTGDLNCRHDGAGELPAHSAIPARGRARSGNIDFGGSYLFELEIRGGFLPKFVPNLEAALPIRVVRGPLGNLWVLDQGDGILNALGRLYRFDPFTQDGGFGLILI